MKKFFLSNLLLLATSIGVMAADVKGIAVEYVDSGTPTYNQAISVIGRIEFKEESAFLVFKDETVQPVNLGKLSSLNRIALGNISESNIAKDNDDNGDAIASVCNITISTYPNPTSDVIRIEGMEDGQIARLFNLNGRLVLSTNECEINLGNLPQGDYLLQVGTEIIKVVKM